MCGKILSEVQRENFVNGDPLKEVNLTGTRWGFALGPRKSGKSFCMIIQCAWAYRGYGKSIWVSITSALSTENELISIYYLSFLKYFKRNFWNKYIVVRKLVIHRTDFDDKNLHFMYIIMISILLICKIETH